MVYFYQTRIHNQLLFIVTLIILNFFEVCAQVKTITVVTSADNEPLQNVLIYHRAKLIGETNKLGKVTIQLDKIDSIMLVKNEFIDVILARHQVSERITMGKNQVFVLKEVIVTPMTVETLLKKIARFKEGSDEEGSKMVRSSYDLPQNLHIYNKLMSNTDTLHYLNSRFIVDKNVFKMNVQTKIIKNFKNVKVKENIYKTYYWGNGKQSNLPGLTSLTPLGIHHSVDFSNFFEHQNLFEFKMLKDANFYKLEFKQKKKIGWFNIEGFLIVDKYDFGVCEFESRLLGNKPFLLKETNFSNSKSIVFSMLTDTYHFKYGKENGRYILENSSKHSEFIEKKGQYKGSLFTSTIQVERTINYTDDNVREFDVYKWEFK